VRLQFAQVPVQPQEDILRHVLRVGKVAQQAQRGNQNQAFVLPDEQVKCGQVARFGGIDQPRTVFRPINRRYCRQKRQRLLPSIRKNCLADESVYAIFSMSPRQCLFVNLSLP
jgi:hypothetical protein